MRLYKNSFGEHIRFYRTLQRVCTWSWLHFSKTSLKSYGILAILSDCIDDMFGLIRCLIGVCKNLFGPDIVRFCSFCLLFVVSFCLLLFLYFFVCSFVLHVFGIFVFCNKVSILMSILKRLSFLRLDFFTDQCHLSYFSQNWLGSVCDFIWLFLEFTMYVISKYTCK